MIIVDLKQGDESWFAEKIGKPSSSRASEILTKTGLVSKSRGAYCEELAWEILTGTREEGYKNQSMQDGNDHEDRARATFELIHGVEITQVGCVYPDDTKDFLCSPDGLIMEREQGYETKRATKRSVQTQRLKNQAPDNDHFCQIQMSLLVTGWGGWYYHSHHDTLPPMIVLVERDNKYIAALKFELEKFHHDLLATVEKFRKF